eukprot:TRINITY_DN85_c0_g2_i2.p1 TRINITY_DN85_c0_g2~~TRINITY_DN85_c0_g2_i2.p1  ORF type:complete len:220 (-),score=63.57 TRINITY_DN85_c0_g2_i2:674-1333(-)
MSAEKADPKAGQAATPEKKTDAAAKPKTDSAPAKPKTDSAPAQAPAPKKNNDARLKSARMLFPTSGRVGFANVEYNGAAPPKDVMVKMLRRENEIRLTDDVQEQLDKSIVDDSDSYTAIIEGIQKTVLKQFGFEDNENNLTMYRAALSLYPNDDEIKNEAYYYKYNRSRQGTLKQGDSIDLQTLSLYNLSTNQTENVFDILQVDSNTNLPLVLIAGSIS